MKVNIHMTNHIKTIKQITTISDKAWVCKNRSKTILLHSVNLCHNNANHLISKNNRINRSNSNHIIIKNLKIRHLIKKEVNLWVGNLV
jgi:hypothetical protein